ncbi:protein of unknown function [Taphrina deformans PYCC 5710]|uniref:tRNA(Ile)-lysidine synthetase n=1 Tax=Taphrina deformans (strain PYCC 5710 / ATCC 11124 / CBS 356.35 / IMI 108563 / JCM 9778 / NBRC 8474) TaxID=1097556 RepID=R4XGX9_TAPDE|nr:protein of unknown function [Taphrina deformans PYCC 5710]|eukprot:CCG84948.1 protein of unknown function [Taphrina deformans PYCC 5710]
MATKALSALEFRRLLPANFNGSVPKAIALSGGADSIALASLLRQELQSIKHLYAFTVDHGLRAEGSVEAQFIHEHYSSLGFHHEILGIKALPRTGIEKNARTARYSAITQACLKHGITELYLGHHADDQAETVLMRMMQGSGWRGLAGMWPIASNPLSMTMIDAFKVRLFRPLLSIPKVRLLATCRERQLRWHEDSSNHDTALTPRNAIRYALRTVEDLPEALKPMSLVQMSLDMQRGLRRENSDVIWVRKACQASLCRVTGSITFRVSGVAYDKQSSSSVQVSLLEHFSRVISPVAAIDRKALETVQQLLQKYLREPSLPLQCTAAGLLWKFSEGDCQIQRQPFGRAETPLVNQVENGSLRKHQVQWDRRFWVCYNRPHDQVEIRALRKEDIKTMRTKARHLPIRDEMEKFLSIAKGQVRFTLPILVDRVSRRMLAIPSAGIKFDTTIDCDCRLVAEHIW